MLVYISVHTIVKLALKKVLLLLFIIIDTATKVYLKLHVMLKSMSQNNDSVSQRPFTLDST